MNQQEFLALIDKYLAGTASAEEADLLSRYYNSFQEGTQWDQDQLGQPGETGARIFSSIQERLNKSALEQGQLIHMEAHPDQKDGDPFRKRRLMGWFIRVAAAACILGAAFLGWWIWKGEDARSNTAQVIQQEEPPKNDVLPGGDKAVLQLGDGSTIVLDEAQNGALAEQGATKILKMDGQVRYDAESFTPVVHYNTITTPRGGKYQIVLADGTQVWLNAASSLHFPTAFAGTERRVEITGEAYFDVVKDPSRPFIVRVNGAEVQVLGTQFNVMAYAEEPTLSTTLVEGSVRFLKGDKARMLEPGQQLQLLNSGDLQLVKDPDIDAALAWKNGLFQFHNTDLHVVMRQLERWYNIEVEESSMPHRKFNGNIPRNVALSQVLKMMEVTSGLQFGVENLEVEGRPMKKIVIK